MRIKLEGKRKDAAVIAGILLAVIAIVGAAAAFCLWFIARLYASGTGTVTIGVFEQGSWGDWSCQYYFCDGPLQKDLSVEGTVLCIETETKSGTISMEVQGEDGEILFHEEDMGTGSFELPVSGPVTVYVGTEDHKGGFKITSADASSGF